MIIMFVKKDEVVKKYKGILITLLVVVFVVSIVLIIILFNKKGTKLSAIEELKLRETSNSVIDYIDQIENSQSTEIDRYINYCLEKVYNEENKTSLTVLELKEIVSKNFTVNISEKQFEEIGITSDMLSKNITYDFTDKKYTMNIPELSYSDIANQEIIKYIIDKIEKDNTRYVITYKKYLVKNPYEILNYYNDLNNKASQPVIDEKTGEIIEQNGENSEYYDTSEIMAYLKGNAKISVIKKYITEENASVVGEQVGTVKIAYVFRNNQILIDSISK
mgnify:CR=1 FL=1